MCKKQANTWINHINNDQVLNTARRQTILWYCDFNFIINLDQLTFKYQTCRVQNINKGKEIFLMPWTKEYTVNNFIKLTRTQQTVKYGAQGKTQSGNKDLKEKRRTAWITSVCVCVRERGSGSAARVHRRAPVYLTSGLVLSSSPHWCALYFFTSAMYLVQASPFPASTCVKHTHRWVNTWKMMFQCMHTKS